MQLPRKGEQDLLKSWDRFSGKRRGEPTASIEFLQLSQVRPRDKTAAVGGPLQRFIVNHHWHTIPGEVNIEFKSISSEFNGSRKGRHSIFRGEA